MLSIQYIGFDKLAGKLDNVPRSMKREVGIAVGKSMEMVATEAKRRTPLDTGYLRSSIGSESHPDGIFRQKGFTGYVGTNVEYAWRQHEETTWNHTDGEAKYMEKGARKAKPYVKKTMHDAIERVLSDLEQ